MTSIGGLSAGLAVEDFFAGVSMPRNREIMRIFKDVEMVEQLGSGMNRILRDYDRSIFTIADSYIRVSFKYVMRIDEQSVNSPRTDKKISSRTVAHVSKTVSKEAIKANILSYVRENPNTSYQEIAESTGVVRSTVGKYLKEMIEAGLIKRVGNNKSWYWEILKFNL